MRIPRSWVPLIADNILDNLISKDLIEIKVPKKKLLHQTEDIILEEMMVEDRLNEEVREFLKSYEKEIGMKRLDYKKLFDMTKQKLIKEKNLIL